MNKFCRNETSSLSAKKGKMSFQDLGPFERKWRKLADQTHVNSIFVRGKDKQVLVVDILIDMCYLLVLDSVTSTLQWIRQPWPRVYLKEGTYHTRLFRGPSTNDMKR